MALLIEGLGHGLQQRCDIIDLSLATTNAEWRAGLYALADQGFFEDPNARHRLANSEARG
jgi:hypothetical protein